MLQQPKSALIIRFSSFGDIVQSTFAGDSLAKKGFKVDLLTKKDFVKAFSSPLFPYNKVLSYEKFESSLWSLARKTSKKNYSLIYDAHNNQRSLLFKFFLLILNPLIFFRFKTRSKFRFKRFLLFNFKINTFPKPFNGASSFLDPLKLSINKKTSSNTKGPILLAPSATWYLKTWPKNHWVVLGKKLISQGHSIKFIGGPNDDFIKDISIKVNNFNDFTKKPSWSETIETIKNSPLLISGDTGVLHIADYFGVKAIALMGPSAFGRPLRQSSTIIYKNLSCQPCSKDGRGKCKNSIFKKCLVSITPEEVLEKSRKTLESLNS